VCDAFSEALGRKVQRNIGQARDGGNDIDIGPLVVECKRRKTLGTVYGWLNQAIAAIGLRPADPSRLQIPIVVARQDAGTSIVIMRLEDFLELTTEELKFHVERKSRRELDALPTSD
jgi:hypothetical protein